jgi:hypothetical protein
MRTVKLVVIGNSGVGKTSLRGQVRTTIPSFLANRNNDKVCLWPLLDKLPCNHWHRFHFQNATSSLRSRSNSDSSNMGPSLAASLFCSHHSSSYRIQPAKSASRHSQLHFSVVQMPLFSSSMSISLRRCMRSPDGGLSFVPSHRSEMRTWKNTALW